VPAALFLTIAAPYFLRLFGSAYADHGTTPLRLMALSSIPAMVTALYTSVWRAEKRLSLLVRVRSVLNTTLVLLSLALLQPYGIRGAAFAWLAVQTAGAVVLLVAWPRVLLGDGSRPPRRLHGIRRVRNVATDTGLLPALQGIKRRPTLDRRLARAEVAVPRILAELPENGSPPSAWTARRLSASVTDKIVVLVGPPGAPPCAAVKLADSASAARGLIRETEVLRRLSGDPRLESWRVLLPKVLAQGELDGEPFRVEGVLSGLEASRLADRTASGVQLGRLASAIGPLHDLTGTELEVDSALVTAWVDEPLVVLESHLRRKGRLEGWEQTALERIRRELHEALLGRRLTASWTHGDYAPGNVLIDPPTGAVNGIVDWELAATPNLPALDLVQLVLSSRAIRRRREYGEIVVEAFVGAWTEEERAVLEQAGDGAGELSDSALVLLMWLRQTGNLLTKADGYADNWLWQRLNVEAPLAALA
jgi:aminoglycoside phosphotransferase (APT) family kinase protein